MKFSPGETTRAARAPPPTALNTQPSSQEAWPLAQGPGVWGPHPQAPPSCPHTPRHHSPQSARQPKDRLPTQLRSRSGLWTRVPAMLQKEHLRGHENRSPPPDAPPRCPEAQLPEEALHSGPAHCMHSPHVHTHTYTRGHTHTISSKATGYWSPTSCKHSLCTRPQLLPPAPTERPSPGCGGRGSPGWARNRGLWGGLGAQAGRDPGVCWGTGVCGGPGVYLAVAHAVVVVPIGQQHVVQGPLQAGLRVLPELHVVREGPVHVCGDPQSAQGTSRGHPGPPAASTVDWTQEQRWLRAPSSPARAPTAPQPLLSNQQQHQLL